MTNNKHHDDDNDDSDNVLQSTFLLFFVAAHKNLVKERFPFYGYGVIWSLSLSLSRSVHYIDNVCEWVSWAELSSGYRLGLV